MEGSIFDTNGWKTSIHDSKIGVWGLFDPLNGVQYGQNPKSTSLRESTSFEHENPSTGLTCRWVPQKRV